MEDNKNIAKNYDPKEFEERLYNEWLEKGYFTPQVDKTKKPFTIVMPPPNITGQLHMGHALDNTLQDALIRWKRMQGYETLWLPGEDHASIATEVKVEAELAKKGINKKEIGREEFLKHVWDWTHTYRERIKKQLQKMGASCDWTRERFTMDEGLNKAVREVFVRLYNKGLIYRGNRIINWCPRCMTALSDAEIEYQEKQGNLWHIKYPVKDSDEYIVIATTRPETMLGDVAVAVNPNDERYKHLIGKTLILPLVNREIPIIADEYVEMEFGTGAVKITPAHDPNDFEVGQRHNLEQIVVMNDNGTMNELAGKYAGLDRYDARKQIVNDLQELGLLVKIEEHNHNVGAHDRCGTTVEPLLSKQWFVKMKPLAEPAIEAVKNGEVEFVPERFAKVYFNWMENIQDWCISRQLWWGHRIPVWYCQDCGEVIVSSDEPDVCQKCGSSNLKQDEDVLDTWFSSALWPFSTLGWPDKTEDLEYFFPTDVLVTGYDIIFFWVARMIFSAINEMGSVPFKHVLVHGIVRDSQGRKMSKSLGNGIDPLEIIDKYGADALRFTLVTGNSPGNDMRFYMERVEASRNFANKIWNASRFMLMNYDEELVNRYKSEANDIRNTADRWILSRINEVAKEVTDNLNKFELGIAAQKIYDFIWSELCDWYIELVKPRLYGDDEKSKAAAQITLIEVLKDSLKLLHPFMPFITEEIYKHITDETPSITIAKWPEFREDRNYQEDMKSMEYVIDAIRAIRNIRAEMNVPNSRRAKIMIIPSNEAAKKAFEDGAVYFEKLAFASEVVFIGENEIPKDAVSQVTEGAQIYMPLEDLIDKQKEIERLTKEKEKLEKEVERAEGKLNNPNFVAKAPQKLVDEEKEKLAKYKEMLEKVIERLNALK
ncbi:valine--tRNA ligase [Caloramator proteoclasticus]|uniref:Valine--tRNA ligase n=1 Tax=Caloramator proteoclasticus DSM 10124 TaxID=1121262 RepID=A0A1M4Z6P9_9CLOT|nr:valine--tRNA ligase [Caloramator proteoclasticus]SHF13680.1 valyl-tRNA synthetase [Caloramator proteoclasticus DSM 10124]